MDQITEQQAREMLSKTILHEDYYNFAIYKWEKAGYIKKSALEEARDQNDKFIEFYKNLSHNAKKINLDINNLIYTIMNDFNYLKELYEKAI